MDFQNDNQWLKHRKHAKTI